MVFLITPSVLPVGSAVVNYCLFYAISEPHCPDLCTPQNSILYV